MKALIRDDEVIPETDWNEWILAHLDWMTTPRPDGDGYTMIEIEITDELNETV